MALADSTARKQVACELGARQKRAMEDGGRIAEV
jgi:hypothetical protein